MVDGGSLENCWAVPRPGGSNPSPSAKQGTVAGRDERPAFLLPPGRRKLAFVRHGDNKKSGGPLARPPQFRRFSTAPRSGVGMSHRPAVRQSREGKGPCAAQRAQSLTCGNCCVSAGIREPGASARQRRGVDRGGTCEVSVAAALTWAVAAQRAQSGVVRLGRWAVFRRVDRRTARLRRGGNENKLILSGRRERTRRFFHVDGRFWGCGVWIAGLT